MAIRHRQLLKRPVQTGDSLTFVKRFFSGAPRNAFIIRNEQGRAGENMGAKHLDLRTLQCADLLNIGGRVIIPALSKHGQAAADLRLHGVGLQRQSLVEIGTGWFPLLALEMDKSPTHQQGQARGVARVHLQAPLEIL